MSLELSRIILFTPDVAAMAAFYEQVIGLEVITREEGWVEFRAGACGLALHSGQSIVGSRPPKPVFHAADVAATRALLIKRGLKSAGKVKSAGVFDLCDCKDPDGNPFQISSRRLGK